LTRYAVLSDIHGNLHALRAALAVLERERVDGFLCAGDLIGYGPMPNECVQLVASLSAVCIAGNHELIALGRLADDRCTPFARESLRWTRGVLAEETTRYLADLPEHAAVPGVVLAHGSLDDPSEYVTRPEQAERQLDRLERQHPDDRILVLGHTHHPWVYSRPRGTLLDKAPGSAELAQGERYLLNPGSVGQSRDSVAHARFAVLDLDARRAEFHSVAYDLKECRAALRRRGLPVHSCHYKPPVYKRAKRALMRLARDLVR
jgi:predicted phosphodiesterase